jgi:hypothetical protein
MQFKYGSVGYLILCFVFFCISVSWIINIAIANGNDVDNGNIAIANGNDVDNVHTVEDSEYCGYKTSDEEPGHETDDTNSGHETDDINSGHEAGEAIAGTETDGTTFAG